MGITSNAGAGPAPEQSLTIIDNRTNSTYKIPITDNSILASDFKKIKASSAAVIGDRQREENETEGGLRVYDAGFTNTAVLRSTITYIDGERGILRYRGYPIEELAASSNFLEVAYLLLYGDLPTKRQYKIFSSEVMHHSFVHRDVEGLMESFRYDSHPMAMLTSAFAALGAFSPEANPALQGQNLYTNAAKGDMAAMANMDKQIYRLIGKAPTLATMAYRVRQGRPFNKPPLGLSFAGSFLYMIDALNEREYKPNPVLERALDILFILHADHELNASTATVLQVGSTLADPYTAVSAGCAALYGPSHGGANEAVVRMLEEIGGKENVPKFIEQVKKKTRVLSGFGHRVYKNTDPRSTIIRQVAEDVFRVAGRSPLLDTALALKEAAETDSYFIDRKLYPNVDFYSGICYKVLGLPTDFYVLMFAVPRVVGWLAHWRQMVLQSSGVKIWRPRQIYVGEAAREYVPMDAREQQLRHNEPDFRKTPVPISHGGDTKRRALATFKDQLGRVHVGSKL
ncbi:citrate synthase [Tilletiaria anomala UBC 951]|uniref:Citrate synthase n=1 Tax=Tilletiaria anomala (strain ATCC 24038 / CBS 436.72 / UBC 951) TaxID=1037660 RepID=A0A066VPX3_TILAU|nr:citrate synthase [Tilletiaria anomala UBC 951]KDN43792.1 citrate synthase [Tilletiaria anomala UBC 951]